MMCKNNIPLSKRKEIIDRTRDFKSECIPDAQQALNLIRLTS
jgi:hypothetical protein